MSTHHSYGEQGLTRTYGGFRAPAVGLTWQERAACIGENPEMFYPGSGKDVTAPALAICARCPAIEECGEYALAIEGDDDWRTRFGIWGGMTPQVRQRVAKQRRLAADTERQRRRRQMRRAAVA